MKLSNHVILVPDPRYEIIVRISQRFSSLSIYLSGANLTNATLLQANLTEVNLADADLTGVVGLTLK